jgi:hypothetical protein
VRAEVFLGFQHHDFAAAARESASDREADHAGPDYGTIDRLRHRRFA